MKDNIADFKVIEILMPCYLDYWSNSLRYNKRAGLLSLKKYQQIRHFIHIVNNDDENYNIYFKIIPLLDIISERKLQLDNESRFSIDEMMISYKGRKSYDNFRDRLFTGEELFELGPKVVIALCKTIHNPATPVVYFDKFFSTLPLVHYLRNEQIKIYVVRWFDNKTVTVVCSYADAYPVSSVESCCKDTREKIDIACSFVVKKYNTHMGGVDLADMLIALYRTPLKTNRRRELQLRKMKHEMPLKAFQIQLFESLTLKKRVCGRSSKNTSIATFQRIETPMKLRPSDKVRLDKFYFTWDMQDVCQGPDIYGMH
ncbi:hypothetical protein PR048_030756 [Dryococelus australis]|uniref:PiggyBac transposable element-derived protein domain-containing protein n=1 Tax=Dryococelus australis TaxID=614101 RepID=A0ABQ9GCD9_9NEOP|nr:hypothetical protein PR048_030756 [Dryococelus australis]